MSSVYLYNFDYNILMEKYLAAIGAFPGIKTAHWQKLIAHFSTLDRAWVASYGELKKTGLEEKWIKDFFEYRDQADPEEILLHLKENEIDIVSIYDDGYPQILKEIYNPPFILYQKGRYLEQDNRAVAIVGSRKGTDYGKRVTFDIARSLAEAGVTIVSGLAVGLDTEAHKGALAGGGRTIAILANGLDQIYPASNTALAQEIIKNGCLFSEQPFGMPPLKQNFPARNRIISGLSEGVLITEADEKSGTLHTASFALEQNRQIYAVPGPVYNPLAKGPNSLLKHGAKAVTEANDILEDYGLEKVRQNLEPEGEEEELIYGALKDDNLHIDEIARRTGRQTSEISKTLTLMELRGKIKHLGGMVYTLC
jgi:DNA processing protein